MGRYGHWLKSSIPRTNRIGDWLIKIGAKVISHSRYAEIRSHVLCKPGRNNNRRAFPRPRRMSLINPLWGAPD